MKQPSRSLVALAMFLAVDLAGCSPAPPEPDQSPPDVTVSRPLQKDVTDYASFTGRTAAVETVKVRARVWGYLDKINFKEGDEVKEGQVLFEIDPQTYQTAVDQAKARLALAQAPQDMRASVAARDTLLANRGAGALEELDKAKADLKTSTASISSAQADLDRAQLDLDYTRVKAPISGRVSRTMVTKGNLIESGETGGTLLTTIVSVDPVQAYFDVDDLTAPQVSRLVREGLRKGTPEALPKVWLGLADEEGYPHEGRIDFVDNQVDPGTGTLKARGVFANKDGVLTPGLFARVKVPLGEPHPALLVTDRAVDTDQGQKVLYIVKADNVVEKRDARLGGLHDGLREVKAGANPGEQVIVDGIQWVRNGVAVKPTSVDMSTFQDPHRAPDVGAGPEAAAGATAKP